MSRRLKIKKKLLYFHQQQHSYVNNFELLSVMHDTALQQGAKPRERNARGDDRRRQSPGSPKAATSSGTSTSSSIIIIIIYLLSSSFLFHNNTVSS
jgi:hypothetical protein